MSGGDIAFIIGASGLAFLLLCLGYLVLRLSRTVDSATRRVEQSAKIIDEVTGRIAQTEETLNGVNLQLARVDVMTKNVEQVTQNVQALSGVFAATVGGPVVKVASLSYGVRRAIGKRQQADLQKDIKAGLKDAAKTQKIEDKASRAVDKVTK